MNTPIRVVALLTLGVLTASIANAARSKPLPWVLDIGTNITHNPKLAESLFITFDEMKATFRQYTAAIIDARSPEAYEKGHLEGAYNVPSTAIEANMAKIYQNVAPSQRIVVYCDGGNCEASQQVADFLQASGFKNLKIFHDGWEVLGKGELPIATGPEPMPGMGGDPSAPGGPDNGGPETSGPNSQRGNP